MNYDDVSEQSIRYVNFFKVLTSSQFCTIINFFLYFWTKGDINAISTKCLLAPSPGMVKLKKSVSGRVKVIGNKLL